MMKRLIPMAYLVVLMVGLAGCGGAKQPPAAHQDPHKVMAQAKKHLDHAASVHFTLSTASVPKKGNAVLGAAGLMTHAPAFKGTVRVILGGLTAEVPVVAVAGKVHAKLPLQTRYAVINPSDYSAPDPARFMDPATGLSSLLTKIKNLKRGSQTRSGNHVLTSYTGTLAGSDIEPIIPSANKAQTYRTVVGVDDRGFPLIVQVTGSFFTASGPVTYTMTLDQYGKAVKITAP